MSIKTKGEKLIGVTFIEGNNKVEQNDLEALARMVNKIEKARHLGENFDYNNNSVENLNWTVDQAQTHIRKAAIFLKEALEINQPKRK